MKTQSLLLGLLLSLSVYAQFPEPKNFGFACSYITIDQIGTCGDWKNGFPPEITGPAYCSYFEWSSPDTSTTTAHLDGYKLYYQYKNDNSITVLSTLTDTSLYKPIGIIGDVWVTAIYSNPAGESSKSNIVANMELPISLDKTKLISDESVFYDKYTQTITLKNGEYSQLVSIIDANGKMLRTMKSSQVIDVSDLSPGLYFVEYSDIELNTSRYKFIKK